MAISRYEHSVLESAINHAVCLWDGSAMWYDFRKGFSADNRKRFKKKADIRLDDKAFDAFIARFRSNKWAIGFMDNLFMTSEGVNEFNSNTIPALELMLRESLDTPQRMHRFDTAARGLLEVARGSQMQLSPEQEEKRQEVYAILKRKAPYELRKRISSTDLELLATGVVCAVTMGPVALYTNDRSMIEMVPYMQELVKKGQLNLKYPANFYSTIGRKTFGRDATLKPKAKKPLLVILVPLSKEAEEKAFGLMREYEREGLTGWMKENLPHLGYTVDVESPDFLRMSRRSEKYAMVGKVALFNSDTDRRGLGFAACITDEQKNVTRCAGYHTDEGKEKPLFWHLENPCTSDMGRITFGMMESFLSGATNIRAVLDVCRAYKRKKARAKT